MTPAIAACGTRWPSSTTWATAEPDIQVYDAAPYGDRSLTLSHIEHNRRELNDSRDEVLKHVARLWGFDVRLETAFEDGKVELTHERQAPH